MMSMSPREIFPNAPLEFVAAEVRFPYSPRLGRDKTFEALIDSLRDVFPLPQREERQDLVIGPQGARAAEPQVVHRLLDRSRTASVTVSQTSTVVETTAYKEFEGFRMLIERALEGVAGLDVVVGVERIGLRYIDEIRVPGVRSVVDWEGYINPTLLGPVGLADGGVPEAIEGSVAFRTDAKRGVRLRFASLQGSGVVGDGPLKRRGSPAPGQFFVIDTDSFWQSDEFGDFSVEGVLDVFDLLHEPVGQLFHNSITEKLKDEVLRKEPR